MGSINQRPNALQLSYGLANIQQHERGSRFFTCAVDVPAAVASQSGSAGIFSFSTQSVDITVAFPSLGGVSVDIAEGGTHAGMPPSRLDRRRRRALAAEAPLATLSAGAHGGIPPAKLDLLLQESPKSSLVCALLTGVGRRCGAHGGAPLSRLDRRLPLTNDERGVFIPEAHGGNPPARLARRFVDAEARAGSPF